MDQIDNPLIRPTTATDLRDWYEWLWERACALHSRYSLTVRAVWWKRSIDVETIAALAAWVDRYDSGEWDDPPGKLSLLFDLPRVQTLLNTHAAGEFVPVAERIAFDRFLDTIDPRP